MSATSRRLIAVDVENLLGCDPAIASAVCWEFAVAGLLHAVTFRKDMDHLVIAVAPDWAFVVMELAPSARLVVRQGANGADLALCDALEDTAFIAGRYSKVVLASGDHIFSGSVRSLADAGVHTTVAGLPTQTSSELTAFASSVMWLDRPAKFLGEAATVRATRGRVDQLHVAPVHVRPMLLPPALRALTTRPRAGLALAA